MPWNPFPPRDTVPRWAVRLTQLSEKILKQQETIMTQVSDLTADFQAAVAELKAEDGVIFATLNKLVAQSQPTGSISTADLQAGINTIRGEVGKLAAAVQAADPPPMASAR